MGSWKLRIAAEVFSPSAVCASSQITSWYAVRETSPTWRGGPGVGAGGLAEAGGGDRLAGGRRVAEAIPPYRAGVVCRLELVVFVVYELELVVGDEDGGLPFVVLVLFGGLV